MKVLFPQKDTMVRIAVMELSAVLKAAGHECEVLIDAVEKDLVGKAAELAPDLIAFSCITGGQNWVLDIAGRLKARLGDVPVLVGGPHATFFPEILLEPHVDIVCRGEGEEAILEIVEALSSGKPEALAEIPNVWVERDGEVVANDVRPLCTDLDALPFPDWDLYRSRYAFLVPYYQGNFPVIMSRGCPYTCTYCFNRSYQQLYRGKGRYMRRETPESAIGRLERMRDEFKVRRFNFVDDSFAQSAQWVREFTALYRERVGLPYVCNVRADTITDETAKLLHESGCYCLRMGIESGDERVRYEILDKRVTDEQIATAAAETRRNGMKLVTYNIYGSPGESLGEALKTFEINRRLRVTFPQSSVMQPYPGTRVREIAEEMGLMPPYDSHSASDVGESYFTVSPIQIEHKREIMNLQKLTPTLVRWRVPTPLARKLIAFPGGRVYHLLFQAEYAFFRFALDAREAVPFLRFALRSARYMAEQPKKAS